MRLDTKDFQIIYHLDIDSRQSNQKIAHKLGISKQSVNYRIKKLVDNNIITGWFADMDYAKFGYKIYKIYLQFQNMTDDVESSAFDYLIKHPAGIWVASCNGRYDAVFTFKARNDVEFEKIKDEVVQEFSKFILNKQIVINIRHSIYNRKWLNSNNYIPVGHKYEGLVTNTYVDDIDRVILKELFKNSRVPILQLSTLTQMSSPQIISRIRKLKERNILTSFKINIDIKKFQKEYCKALIYLQNTTPERKKEFLKACSNQMNVTAIVDVIGPWDVELELEVSNFEQYTTILSELRKQFSDIFRNYESIIITKETGRMYKILD
ncbi:Lrp/AsnC family transcriptional regulator [Candidatus Woesearchaeota archaeon]|nr:Lrp/AsnC family transcriptional regulator [Candidatus Woesearchaeota archaeon]